MKPDQIQPERTYQQKNGDLVRVLSVDAESWARTGAGRVLDVFKTPVVRGIDQDGVPIREDLKTFASRCQKEALGHGTGPAVLRGPALDARAAQTAAAAGAHVEAAGPPVAARPRLSPDSNHIRPTPALALDRRVSRFGPKRTKADVV